MLPLFSFERAEAKLFSPMAYTVAFALLARCSAPSPLCHASPIWAFRRPRRMFYNRPVEWLQAGYQAILGRLLRRPSIVYIASLACLAAIVFFSLSIGREFLPELDEGALWLQVQMPTGLSLDRASEMAGDLRRAVREFPEVSYVITQTGRSDDGTDPWTFSHIEAPVGLTPASTWPAGETKARNSSTVSMPASGGFPGFPVGISQPIIEWRERQVGGAHSPLVIRVFGNDFSELRRIVVQIVDILTPIRGTTEASIFQEPPIPQMPSPLTGPPPPATASTSRTS